jgi:hypothetical protein
MHDARQRPPRRSRERNDPVVSIWLIVVAASAFGRSSSGLRHRPSPVGNTCSVSSMSRMRSPFVTTPTTRPSSSAQRPSPLVRHLDDRLSHGRADRDRGTSSPVTMTATVGADDSERRRDGRPRSLRPESRRVRSAIAASPSPASRSRTRSASGHGARSAIEQSDDVRPSCERRARRAD